MGKRTTEEIPKSKKQKSKHKEMFTELATHQQEVVQRKLEQRNNHLKRVIEDDSQEQVELDVLQHENTNLDRICQTVHRLLSKNKVSAKNAFDVPLIDLQKLPDFSQSLQNEYAWKKLSSTLENDYKIYAYRVDAIHSITYNILHTMSRRQQDIDSIQNSAAAEPVVEIQPLKISEGSQSEHLERRLENINLSEIQLILGVDPILQRNKRKFDQLGNNSMLMNTLMIDEYLALELVKSNNSKNYPPVGDYLGPWEVDDRVMAFIEIADFRAKVQENLEGKMKNQDICQYFQDQKQNHFIDNLRSMNLQDLYFNSKKYISHQIKFKPRQLRTEKDIIEDANIWMEEIDKKFLGYNKKSSVKIQNGIKVQVKEVDPADMVDFALLNQEEDTRESVFRKENDKNQFHEEIEDRFLLANKLPYSHHLFNNLLTLMDNPEIPEIVPQIQTQVDVRRQLVSILQAKRRMKNLMHQRSTFRTIYQGYGCSDEISPALCFLTVLHLANENGLSLEQIDECNFYVH